MANPNPSSAAATPDKTLESPGTWIDISAASPLFAYEPQRNSPAGWSQDTNGGSTCSGGGPYAVGIDGIYCESVQGFSLLTDDQSPKLRLSGLPVRVTPSP